MLNDIINNKNINLIYIFTTNFTILFAKKLRDYLKKYKIRCVIYDNYYKSLENKCIKDENLFFIFIGTTLLYNNNIDYLPYKKYIIYQIEQLNQTLYYYHYIDDNMINLINNSLDIYDYSLVNLNYYYKNINKNINKNIKLFIPFIPFNNNINEIHNINQETNNNLEKNIIFLGSLNNRRRELLNKIKLFIFSQNLKINLIIFDKLFDSELLNTLNTYSNNDNNIILNLHYYDNAILEVFRFEDIIPYNIKILSEKPGTIMENDLIKLYSEYVEFFPVINPDFNNIDELYYLITNI